MNRKGQQPAEVGLANPLRSFAIRLAGTLNA